MSNGVNKVIILGNVGGDPELRYLSNGKAVVNVSVAVNETYTNSEGERQESVEWFYVSIFGRAAEFVGETCEKGSQVFIEGRLQTREWTDNEGNNRKATGVIARQVIVLRGKKREYDPENPMTSESQMKHDQMLKHDIDPNI